MAQDKVKAYLQTEEGKANAVRFIKALTERRLICSVKNVSSSGMSRTISFCEMVQSTDYEGKPYFHLCQFNWFIKNLGYKYDERREAVRVGGCGMNMVFNTLYNVAAELKYNGFDVPDNYPTLADSYNSI